MSLSSSELPADMLTCIPTKVSSAHTRIHCIRLMVIKSYLV